jgi:hypothetical protein
MSAGFSCAQSANQDPLHFDLSKIGMVINGQQICEDKGRLQDESGEAELTRIIAAGPKAIPVLIKMLTDARMAKTAEPLICYWPGMAIGDIAFCLLSDLFTDESGSKTMPGSAWNDLLGTDEHSAAWEQLHGYIGKHGRAALQAKWQRLWNKYKGQIFWDPSQRCFRLKVAN